MPTDQSAPAWPPPFCNPITSSYYPDLPIEERAEKARRDLDIGLALSRRFAVRIGSREAEWIGRLLGMWDGNWIAALDPLRPQIERTRGLDCHYHAWVLRRRSDGKTGADKLDLVGPFSGKGDAFAWAAGALESHELRWLLLLHPLAVANPLPVISPDDAEAAP